MPPVLLVSLFFLVRSNMALVSPGVTAVRVVACYRKFKTLTEDIWTWCVMVCDSVCVYLPQTGAPVDMCDARFRRTYPKVVCLARAGNWICLAISSGFFTTLRFMFSLP